MDIRGVLQDAIRTKTPVIFAKFGDGEFNCTQQSWGVNCDNDEYSAKKGNSLRSAFKHVVETHPNGYPGMWHGNNAIVKFWERLVSSPVKWAEYDCINFDDLSKDSNKIDVYRAIKESPLKKIIVCNELMAKSKILLNIDHMITVPMQNWFDTQFDSTLKQCVDAIGNDETCIIMTCCGMAGKPLIAELSKLHPKGIYIDVGSALDFICTKTDSRGKQYNYDALETFLSVLIPPGWNDPKYDDIVVKARSRCGLHLPR